MRQRTDVVPKATDAFTLFKNGKIRVSHSGQESCARDGSRTAAQESNFRTIGRAKLILAKFRRVNLGDLHHLEHLAREW